MSEKDMLMTDAALHVIVGENQVIAGQSTDRKEAETQARQHYAKFHTPRPHDEGRPMALYAEIPGTIVSTINSAALTGDTIRQLMEQGHIARHGGITI